jgi:hypothetical protein
MTMLPVADVLIIERKRCAKCLTISEAPSPFRYRLFKSPTNEPDKTEIRKLMWEPNKTSEQADLVPLARRSIYYLDITMDQCEQCWSANIDHAAAVKIRPLPPVTHLNGIGLALVAAAEKRKATSGPTAKRPAFTLDDLAKRLGL